MGSNIRRIPDRAFQGATSLQELFLDANRIETIATSAFVGTQLHTLDLSVNEIHDFIPAVFAPIGSTLRILRLTENRLENLPVNAFDVLPNLVDLELNHNHFFTLPANLFTVPVNLEILQIANCGIQRLQPGLFAGLTNLVDLELGLNELDLLPQNIFDLPRLQTLGLVQNNIRSLDAAVFGRSLNSLVTVDASINRIDAVDPTIVSANSSINSLNLAINSCTDGTFLDIPNFRDQVLAALQGCVNNFNDVPISCVFTEDEAIYECEMTLNNTNDRLSFTEITGEHMEGHNDNFVSHIRGEETIFFKF